MSTVSSFALERAIDRHPPITTPGESIKSALIQMQTAASSYILVAQAGNKFASLLTERDLLNIIVNSRHSSDISLAAVMPAEVITSHIDQITDLLTARLLLRQHKIRHLPLVSDQGCIEGVITYDNLSRLLNPIDLLRLRHVEEVMTSQVIWAPPHTSLTELSNLMASHRVSCIVIGEASPMLGCIRPIGVVTEPHIIHLWMQGANFDHTQAQDLINGSFRCILTTDSLWYAHKLMTTDGTRRLVVVGTDGFLAGVVTQSSLFQSVEPDEAQLTLKTLTNIIDEHTVDLSQANQKLERTIQERKRAKAALQQQIARERLVNRITQNIRQSLELTSILTTAVDEVSAFFQAGRTLIYRIVDEERPAGEIIAEAGSAVAGNGAPTASPLGPALAQLDMDFYASGRVHSVPDLEADDRSSQKTRFLAAHGIRSVLIAPILVKQNLWGLLLLSQEEPRRWERSEIKLFEQITAQIGLAIQQAVLYSQLEIANQKLLNQANTDELTQLSNRRHFSHCLAKEWKRLQREQQPLSVILCDVDHFKLYNDTYGHQAGDDCLKAVAQALKQPVKRPADETARYGGEEFVIVLPNTPLEGAQHVAEQIRLQVQGLNIPHRSSKTSDCVTLSLGVACCIPNSKSSPEELVKTADMALYAAKESGRNRWASESHAPQLQA
ncbi:diguanylate cyclase domain-containing protein [Leptothoe kymatousa]|uniref:Diguanylate cyclase n=1 Tax=Leptothoe kymatousa TAU-MAC 1615 TaxID=2364775 RepID=A0ABS5Y501_9CYAN|nr:diguanylate cyclase [Leptothoe kymatousa]MBT9312434.1 diguanylate cyclase [Leptothoe kymatousa TAU-MAC 1615]